jgi:vacuolar-type H+-ATPase catalytic subunit A/Vma1
MMFEWPVKIPISAYEEKLMPDTPLISKSRIVDAFFPIAKGGTYCIRAIRSRENSASADYKPERGC